MARTVETMRHTRHPLISASWMLLAGLLAIGACRDGAGGGLTEAMPEASRTHITAEEFARALAEDRYPRINWVQWYADGQSETLFPLELCTDEELIAESLVKGRKLPNGSRTPPGAAIRTQWDVQMAKARRRIIQSLGSRPKRPRLSVPRPPS